MAAMLCVSCSKKSPTTIPPGYEVISEEIVTEKIWTHLGPIEVQRKVITVAPID